MFNTLIHCWLRELAAISAESMQMKYVDQLGDVIPMPASAARKAVGITTEYNTLSARADVNYDFSPCSTTFA